MVVRYFIEHLPKADSPHHISQRSKVRMHSRKHVWQRMNDDTIVVMAHFQDETSLAKAAAYDEVLVLPHLHDRTPVKKLMSSKSLHEGKFTALQSQLKLDDSHTTADFIGVLLAAGYSHFEPPI